MRGGYWQAANDLRLLPPTTSRHFLLSPSPPRPRSSSDPLHARGSKLLLSTASDQPWHNYLPRVVPFVTSSSSPPTTPSGDIIVPSRTDRRRERSLLRSVGLLEKVLSALKTRGGWKRNQLVLFGFSMGATVAVEWALRSHVSRAAPFAGVVAVAGGLLQERQFKERARARSADEAGGGAAGRGVTGARGASGTAPTPLLVVGGHSDDVAPPEWLRQTQTIYNTTAQGKGKGKGEGKADEPPPLHTAARLKMFAKGHEMVSSADEMHVVMEFLAEHLGRLLPQGMDDGTLYEVTR